MSSRIIVSRHPAAVEWLTRYLFSTEGLEASVLKEKDPTGRVPGWEMRAVEVRVRADVDDAFGEAGSIVETVRIFAGNVTPEDVEGKDVYGVLPLELAAHARSVTAVQFPTGKAPRGAEYAVEQMVENGAFAATYTVRRGVEAQRRQLASQFGKAVLADLLPLVEAHLHDWEQNYHTSPTDGYGMYPRDAEKRAASIRRLMAEFGG